MQVEVRNIYYLLCYAWEHFEATELIDVSERSGSSPQELFAHVLHELARGLMRSGLDRGYVATHEISTTLSGKLDVLGTLCVMDRGPPRVACMPDLLTTDVLQNQIIKATIRALARMDPMDRKLRDALHGLVHQLQPVHDIDIDGSMFRAVQVRRNNWRYRFALNVCELVHRHTLIEQGTARHRFHDFRGDNREMGLLFEAFVRRFWARHLPALKVSSRRMPWPVECDENALAVLPEMRTDISFRGRTGEGVVECKCVDAPLVPSRYGQPKLRAGHMYQLLSYLNALEAEGHVTAPGLLLYAVDDSEFDFQFRVGEHPVRVRTVNLNVEWEQVHAHLMCIGDDLASA
ncbi:MAG TPA: hypothetical protein VK524_16910 [Polyangiaceae bacterium]|nr:hypothetical protein [Polyangiaceae bacterium]